MYVTVRPEGAYIFADPISVAMQQQYGKFHTYIRLAL